jgi:hypothetical protein
MVTDPQMDAWHHTPTSNEPALYSTQNIYLEQPFRLLVVAKDYSTDARQQAELTYTVQGFSPDNSTLFEKPLALDLFSGRVGNDNLLLSRQYLTLSFSTSDPIGTYRFEIIARDGIDKTESTASAELTLSRFSVSNSFDSIDEFSYWFENYYRSPDPARAIAALLQYVNPESLRSQKQTPLLTFLSRVIQDNPFLWPHIKSLFKKSDVADQKKLLLMFALTKHADTTFISSLRPELLQFYNDAQQLKLVEPSDSPQTELEINILWADFMATGAFRPVQKIVNVLALESTKGAKNILASGDTTVIADLKKRAELESVYQAALGSLIEKGERHSLVKQYLGYIHDLEASDPVVKSQLESILTILQQRSNEEAARKHLEENAIN